MQKYAITLKKILVGKVRPRIRMFAIAAITTIVLISHT